MNLDWPTLETERLILRPWKPEDFEPYARFSADEESMRYLGRDGRPTDAAETWRTICLFIGHWYLRGYTLWAVEEKATGEFVGRVCKFSVRMRHPFSLKMCQGLRQTAPPAGRRV